MTYYVTWYETTGRRVTDLLLDRDLLLGNDLLLDFDRLRDREVDFNLTATGVRDFDRLRLFDRDFTTTLLLDSP